MNLSALAATSHESSYERLVSWKSFSPVLLLLFLLIEWELLRTQGMRLASLTRLTLGVVAVPLGALVILAALLRAAKLVG